MTNFWSIIRILPSTKSNFECNFSFYFPKWFFFFNLCQDRVYSICYILTNGQLHFFSLETSYGMSIACFSLPHKQVFHSSQFPEIVLGQMPQTRFKICQYFGQIFQQHMFCQSLFSMALLKILRIVLREKLRRWMASQLHVFLLISLTHTSTMWLTSMLFEIFFFRTKGVRKVPGV